MLDIKMIRENPQKVNELLKRRNPELSIDKVLEKVFSGRKAKLLDLNKKAMDLHFKG